MENYKSFKPLDKPKNRNMPIIDYIKNVLHR